MSHGLRVLWYSLLILISWKRATPLAKPDEEAPTNVGLGAYWCSYERVRAGYSRIYIRVNLCRVFSRIFCYVSTYDWPNLFIGKFLINGEIISIIWNERINFSKEQLTFGLREMRKGEEWRRSARARALEGVEFSASYCLIEHNCSSPLRWYFVIDLRSSLKTCVAYPVMFRTARRKCTRNRMYFYIFIFENIPSRCE